ncbi:CRISPR-associated endonuclease Cas2 [Candidatus Uhrbacteria bacterium CG10_big_fil_rev_8_21_14_0_10_41_26]|nr:MAG: CRISPR-associated endonuclease Cas2 [Candidatus Uhrbacteria bacterium CG_4_10_14_3_um_filter_41_21]PIZ54348.1 MAG: CRISPR-associated endonuclease Cas2 [Candidatus Uhrbacteria bacterium CG_4_10_14_0_2_um_filter_41_21]PJE75085.1 MAG: CRISPR-associated endonuclease Cas2 [Candidatus Uhrbacteria bacterium CG10_big_fil_rev_8_21_14_0_10_41_26]
MRSHVKCNRMENQKNKVSRTAQVLVDLFNDVDFFLANGRQYGQCGRSLEEMREIKNAVERRERNHAIYRAKQQKLIKTQKEGDKIYQYLTKKGAVSLLKSKIILEKQTLPEGEICFVIFDIPEDIKHVRDTFRKLLKDIGFRMTQRSVWEGDLDIVDDLRSLVDIMNAQKYIRVYHALDIR